MSFKETVAAENSKVFCNPAEFADLRKVSYDGNDYFDVPVVMTKLKEKDRAASVKDHAQGIYLVTAIAHFPIESLGGHVPEKGQQITISDDTGFDREYYVAQSGCEGGMVRIELEAYDE